MHRPFAALLAILLLPGCGADPEAALRETARGIHDRVIAIDTHDDIPENFATAEVDPCVRGDRQVDVVKMEEGGLDVAFFIVYVGQTERTDSNYAAARESALSKFAAIRRMAEEMCPDRIGLAESADDVERIAAEGRLVAAIGVENGYSIGTDLSQVQRFRELGASYFGLVHGGHNDIADSATPREALGDSAAEHGGVSAFGEQVIAEANRVGLMIDVSHASRDAMLDAARLSRAPIIASHSSTFALRDSPRNMDDEQLLALGENGGVAQMVALGEYVKADSPEREAATAQLREELGFGRGMRRGEITDSIIAVYRQRMAQIDAEHPGPGVADFVDHIDHAVQLVGIDHVGISSDFDGGGGVVGWNDASETFNVTLELVRRGYTEDEIARLWGGNLLRVWREVERVAAELQSGG
jgi:membrane dipeptidase